MPLAARALREEAAGLPAAAKEVDGLAARARHRFESNGADAALAAAGLAGVVLGTMVVSPMAARWILAIAGVAAIAKATDRVGKRRTGGKFDVSTVVATAWLLSLGFGAVFAGLLPIEGPHALPLDTETLTRPDLLSSHPLGTDNFGRDYLSRLVYGARVSLAVGIGTVAVGLLIGSLLGVCAGYFRGKVEAVVNAVTDFMLAFPPLVFLLALVAILRPGLVAVFVGLSVLTVPTFVRLAKANTVRVASREYVLAARAMGATHRRVMLREVLPNVLPPLLTYSIVIVPALIVAEAALSFLNLSVRLPYPTWGNMIAETQTLFADNPHTVLLPGAAMFATVFSLNRLGQVARSRWERST